MKLIRQIVKRQKHRYVLFFFLAIFGMQTMFAQSLQEDKVTLNVQNQPLGKVIGTFTQQTGLKFFYSETTIAGKVVTLEFSNTAINTVLAAITRQTQLNFTRENNTITINAQAIASETTPQKGESRKVIGTITDPNGEPIIGANVVEKGTVNGVITDLDGKFTLNIPANTLLTISYIGYNSQEVAVGNRVSLQITLLESSLGLDEVVVIGYGTVRRRDLTGSVSQINSDKFDRVSATNALQAVQGRLPGLSITPNSGRPGAGSDILIHGVQSINGTNAPIFVVDGSITEGIDNINPQDIETLTVLKDASAVAIYGSRASNGVIVVNTKRGNNGQLPAITFKTEQSIQNEGNLRLGFVNAKQWLELATEAYENAGTNVPWTAADLAKVDGVDVCWPDAMKRTGFLTNNNLSVSGGDKKSNYFISLNYLSNKGIIKDQNYQRINLRLNSDHIVRERIKFGHSVNIYASSQTNQRELDGRDTYHASFRETPLNRMYDENGDVTPVINNSFQGRAPSPTWMLKNSEIEDRYKGIDGNIYLSIDILDGLKFTTRGSIGWNNSYTSNFIGGMDPKYNMEGPAANKLTKTNNETLHWIGDFLLDYNKTFVNHSVNALLGYSLEEQTYENLQGIRENTPSNDIRYLAAGDPSTATNNNEYEEWAFLSVFGRAGYSYKDKYTRWRN
ncbi:TonB-dependent receptor SusC [termite gut metagenome]|uniref:TonB-dependent receptor SusC n=1 Tax=termite gut metagenome TaxID=433724 RepID=A0A5J4R7V7_9ZZZZ